MGGGVFRIKKIILDLSKINLQNNSMKSILMTPDEVDFEKQELAKKIRQKRAELNHTQETMAELLDMNVKTYQQIEKGQKIVNFDVIISLMRFIKN